MKICLVTFDFPPLTVSGVATQCRDLAYYLSKAGIDVHVLTAGAKDEEDWSNGLFKITRLKVPIFSKLRKLPTFQFRVWQWLKANNKAFDIIHFQSTSGFLYLLSCLFRRTNNNTIEHFHHSQVTDFVSFFPFIFRAPKESLPYLFLPLIILQEYVCLLGAKQIITVSEHSRRSLLSWGINSSKIAVIPNAIGESFLQKGLVLPQRKSTTTKFLYVGMLAPRKGVNILIDAVNILKKRGVDDFHMDIVGQGPLFKFCQRRITANDLRNCVMRGTVSQQELKELYREADCLICPSRFEGFGIVLLEAGANNLAVIANDIPVFKEIYLEDEALYFRQNDPYDLAQKMLQVMNSPELVASLREKAHKKLKNYLWQNLIKSYLALYSSMVERHG